MIQSISYKIRLYPNITQQIQLSKSFGCVRKVWNYCVECFNKKENIKSTTELRSEFIYMKEVSAGMLQQKERDFDQFKKQYFNKNRKTKLNRPKFKKKQDKQSCRFSNKSFKFDLIKHNNKIYLEKIGWVNCVFDRIIPESNKLISATISLLPSGEYYASILTEEDIQILLKTNRSVGVDVGLKSFLVTSDGVDICNPKFSYDNQDEIARLQMWRSKKVKDSSRYKRLSLRIAKLYQKISNQRDWFQHQVSNYLIQNYDVIAIEDLNVTGMVKNHCLAKSISDVGWSEFFNKLKYKSKWYGRSLIETGRFEPTSKTCSECGWINKDLKLSDREFVCQGCGVVIHRDLNAAINIKNLAIGINVATKRSLRECKSGEIDFVSLPVPYEMITT